jgi:ElaB/YqjD/DUF883 family membrane-anchored ribosome-binding protein
MARVTSLGINVFSHWNGRGLRRAQRNLNQFGDGMNDAGKDANRLNRNINKMNRSSKMLARSLKRPQRDLRKLGDGMRDTDRDTNRFRRSMRSLGRAVSAPFRAFGRLRKGLIEVGNEMIATDRRGTRLTRMFKGMGKRILIGLIPALLPIANYLAGIAVELTAMAAAAAIGFGGFTVLALAASKHALKLAEDNKKMTRSQRRHVDAINAMKKAWHNFLGSKAGGRLLKPLTIGLRAITRNMHKLKPLVNAIAPVFNNIARRFADWMDRSNGFRRFVNHMRKHGVPIMKNLAAAARSVLKFLGRAFRDSLPGARKLSRRIREGARALAKWGAKGGFQRWLKRTKKDGPKVRRFFRELRKLLPKLAEVIRELAPVALKLATAFLKIANNLSPGQLKAIILLWLIGKPALTGLVGAVKAYNFAKKLFNKRTKTGTSATKKSTKATKASKKAMNGLRGAMKGVRGGMGKLITKLGGLLAGGLGLRALGRTIKGRGGLTGIFKNFKGKLLSSGGAMNVLRLAAGSLMALFTGPAGLIALGVLAAGAILWLAIKTKAGKIAMDKFKGACEFVLDVIGDLGGALKAVTNGPLNAFKGAIETGGNLIEDIGGGIADAASALFGSGLHQAFHETNKKAKPFNKHIRKGKHELHGFRKNTKKSEKHVSMFGRKLHIAGKNSKKFGKNAGKSGGGLKQLSKQTGLSRKELKKMGISSKDADGMLKKFGRGAVNTGKKVKDKAGKHFKNGAKNVRKSWDRATIHIRKSTRQRFDKVIHHTRAFRNKLARQFKGVAKNIRKHFGKATESVKDNARKDFNKAGKQAKQLQKGIGKNFHKVAKALRRHWGKATEFVKDTARKDFNKAQKQAKQLRKGIGNQFHKTAKAIRKHWGKATESVKDGARKDFNKTVSHAKNLRQGIEKVFNNIRNHVRKQWNNMLDGVKARAKKRFTEIRKAIENALKKIRKAFDNTVDAIKKIWKGRLPDIFKKPVKFFVEVVYNKGLRKAWNNTFANLPGIKELKKANLGFAQGGLAQRGGKVRGPGGPTADKIPAALSAGEYVVRAKAVKQIGVDTLQRINQGVGGDLPKRGVPKRDDFKRKSVMDSHFADGGMLGSRARHNSCSYYAPFKFAQGGFIPWPTVDIAEVYNGAIKRGVKAAKKSTMLGTTAGMNFGSGNMSNGDESSRAGAGGFDWGTNLYQDVAAKVAKKVLHPFMDLAFRVANKGPFKPTGEWGEVPPTHLKEIMPKLVAMVVAAANVGCGSNGYAPFRPWKSGDGAVSSFRGVRVNRRTKLMCRAAEKKLGKRMSYFQGSFSHASASAGTHAGGGAVDTGPASFRTSGAMRASGFAAWARGSKFGSGSFSPHVHGIAVGDKQLSGPAKAQVKAFFNGKDGLAGNRPDNQPGGGGSCMLGGSGVKRWAPLACTALKLGGCGCSPNKLKEFLDLMRQESGGNPRAQNNWDSNAAAGNASRGLMQVIPTTFRANHVRGTSNNIFDPLANMAASVRYIKRQYGCRIPNAPYAQGGFVLPGMPRGGHPRSTYCSGGAVGLMRGMIPTRVFDSGGILRPGLNIMDNRTGGPEELRRVRHGDHDRCVHVHVHGSVYTKSSREFEGMVVEAVADAKRKKRI